MLNKLKIGVYSAIGALSASTAIFATDGFTNLKAAISDMCCQLMTILPVVSMLMVIGAGVVYAAGQMMGAETRARANTWATAMLIGAVIGILIVVIAPTVLNAIYAPSTGGTTIDSSICVCSP